MRHDFFMIWGNGYYYAPKICQMIRENPNFDIVRIVSINISDMPGFIQQIYSCDHVPIQHLIGKTRYLLNSEPVAMFVLVKNRNPDERYYGEGEFRHIQCSKVKEIKNEIRNMFNPRFRDPSKTVPPLNQGVSHEHCVHASDYESQVEHVLGVLEIGDLSWHCRHDDLPFNITWHASVSGGYEKVTRNLNDLHASLMNPDGSTYNSRIVDTPHYKFVQGFHQEYCDYAHRHIGAALQEDHWPMSFQNLVDNFDIDYVAENGKPSPIIISKDGRIVDGLHRAAIMVSKGIGEVDCIRIL